MVIGRVFIQYTKYIITTIGTKREGNKKEVREAWDRVLDNFPGYFQAGKNLGIAYFEEII